MYKLNVIYEFLPRYYHRYLEFYNSRHIELVVMTLKLSLDNNLSAHELITIYKANYQILQ